jgi:ATP-dependent Zn protease
LSAGPAPPNSSERRYSDETAYAIDQAVKQIVEASFRRSVSILEAHRDLLEEGAHLLLQKEVLDETALRELAMKLGPAQAPAIAAASSAERPGPSRAGP